MFAPFAGSGSEASKTASRTVRNPVPVRRRRLPQAVAREFDAILIDPSRLNGGGSILGIASRLLDHGTDGLTVALRLDHRSGGDEPVVVRDHRVWTFISCGDARQLGERVGGHRGCDVDALVRFLHDRYRIARLVLQRGSRGAVLMNGIPCPYRVQACPLAPVTASGAGDTLLAVTALSSASGADDRTSLRRGVAAATGQVAGLPLPSTLEELDAA